MVHRHVKNPMKPLFPLAIFLTIASNAFAWQQPTSTSTDLKVLQAGKFALSKAEYEKLVLGFDRVSGATVTGASVHAQQSGQDVGRLLALVSEAQKRGIDKDQAMQSLMRVRGYTILANALLADLEKQMKKDEAGTRALWASEKHNYVQVDARHILIRYQGVKVEKPGLKGLNRTEAQAKAAAVALHEKLMKQGVDFAATAKANSDDETNAQLGGVLPTFTRGMMMSEFEVAAFNLPNGGISEPIKTVYGYHIVQVVNRGPMPFEKVRAALENMRARKLYDEIGASGVELSDSYFKK